MIFLYKVLILLFTPLYWCTKRARKSCPLLLLTLQLKKKSTVFFSFLFVAFRISKTLKHKRKTSHTWCKQKAPSTTIGNIAWASSWKKKNTHKVRVRGTHTHTIAMSKKRSEMEFRQFQCDSYLLYRRGQCKPRYHSINGKLWKYFKFTWNFNHIRLTNHISASTIQCMQTKINLN